MRIVVGPLLAAIVLTASAQTPVPGQQTPARATPPRDQQPATGTAVIRGQVVDATTGAPLRRAVINAFAAELRGSSKNAMTDAEGRFEIRDLPAGKYTLAASRNGYIRTTFGARRPGGPGTPLEIVDRQLVEKVVIRISRGGVISGRVMDEFGEPASGVEMRALQHRFEGGSRRLVPAMGIASSVRTDDLGAFRLYGLEPGQFYVSARPQEAMFGAAATPPDSIGSTATYFPNTPDVASAQRVAVAAGRETSNVIITLVSTRLSSVRGRAVMSNGEPFAHTYVNVTLRDAGGSWGRSSGMTQPDGSFDIKGLTPGTYLLTVRPPNSREDDDVEVARMTVSVTGDDVEGVLLVGGRPAVARGHVTTDEGVALPRGSMTIFANPASPDDRYVYVPPARVKDDQSFEIKGLFGQQLLRHGFSGPAGPDASVWMLKAVIWNGTDITDTPIDFQPGQVVEGLEVILTRRAAEVSGAVTTERGAATQENWVVLFPADEARWTSPSRFVRATRPDAQGQYRFRGMPAHDDYLLAAVGELEPGQYADPEFLRSVRDQATRLSIGDGEKKVQNIRLLR